MQVSSYLGRRMENNWAEIIDVSQENEHLGPAMVEDNSLLSSYYSWAFSLYQVSKGNGEIFEIFP